MRFYDREQEIAYLKDTRKMAEKGVNRGRFCVHIGEP